MTDVRVAYSDEEESIAGTVRVVAGAGAEVIFCNAVYRTPEGAYYVTQGSAVSFASQMATGDWGSLSRAESFSTTDSNGQTVSKSRRAELKIAGVDPAFSYTLKQMSKDDAPLATTNVTRENIPGRFTLRPDAAYLIVEETGADGRAIRALVNPQDRSFTLVFPGDFGLARGYSVELGQ